MGNVAISFIQNSLTLTAYVQTSRRQRIEHKRVRSLIPRYLARLNDRDDSITVLDLDALGVDYRILRLLSGALLSGSTRVCELHLRHNWIGPEGAICIARLLSKDTHLKHVSLAHNPVGSVGAMAIASALEQNNSLEKLDLSHCDIYDDGIHKLAHSLKSNSKLKYLYLERNHVSSAGVHSLLKCVYDTTSLQSLWESNHTLRAFYGQRSIYSPTFPETPFNRGLVRRLGEVLATCNRRRPSPPSRGVYEMTARIAARKIVRHYLREEMLEYLECVESMEEKLAPIVIGWLVRHGDVGVIYGVVRDMPWLLEKKVDGRVSREGSLVLARKEESMIDALMVNECRTKDEILQ